MAFKKLKLWFDTDLAHHLAQKIKQNNKDFPEEEFVHAVSDNLESLELKDRIELFADQLIEKLEGSFDEQVAILMNILGPENEEETGMFKNYYWILPIAKTVEKYGLEHFETSMNAIKEITKRSTGEYAIRPFIKAFPEETLHVMTQWSRHKNRHIRRLACEGSRPRLPWATKLQLFIDEPKPLIPILENLKDDHSKYVQNSVANCINDILKDKPTIGVEILEKWSQKATTERRWIIKHALRTWIKKDDPWAIAMIDKMIYS